MVAPPSSVPFTLLGPVTAGTVVWRSRGTLYLTVVVKGTFALVPGGRMSVAPPEAIAAAEQADPAGAGLRTAGDLAPYLGQPEIWLTGHAAVPPGLAHPRWGAQLAVMQGATVRLNKQVQLDVASAAGHPPRVRVVGSGPVAADWPVRSRWLQGIDRRRLSGPVLDIPEGLSWEYFQTAPVDQRFAALQGDEWLVLGAMVAGHPRLLTQLPAASGAARLYRRSLAAPRAGVPVALRADTLQVDLDRLRCSMLWRGRVPVATEAELGSLRLVAGLEQPGEPVSWKDPFEAEAAAARVPFSGTAALTPDALQRIAEQAAIPFENVEPQAARPPSPGPSVAPFASTEALSPEAIQRIAEQAATPFEKNPAPSSAEPAPFAGTTAISGEALQKIAEQLATPFERKPDTPPPEAARPAPSPFDATTGLSAHALQKIAEQLATPFEKPVVYNSNPEPPVRSAAVALSPGAPLFVAAPPTAAPPPQEPSFGSTSGMSPEILQKIAEQAAVPFEKVESAAPSAPRVAPPASGAALRSITGTTALTLDDLEKIAEQAPTPFGMPKNSAQTLTELLADCEPDGLGAELLTALMEAEAL